MNQIQSLLKSNNFFVVAVIALVGGLAYLPFVGQFGYFNDDWYLMYSAGAKGAGAFRDIYSIDRPMRALVMSTAYTLFGPKPLWYNLSAFFFRLLSALFLAKTVSLIWPRQRYASLLMGLLFLVYPGFLSQFNGIDYQSQMISLAAAMFSILLTISGIQNKNNLAKTIPFLFSGLLLCFYIGLVEYFIGFEVVRIAFILLLILRKENSFWKQLILMARNWLPTLLFLIPFIVWRLIFFESERGATDVGEQLGGVLRSPIPTALNWLTTLILDSYKVTILAWGQPLSFLLNWVPYQQILVWGIGIVLLITVLFHYIQKKMDTSQDDLRSAWRYETLIIGVVGIMAGLLPVILVNRSVNFEFYSRYALASSAGVALLLTSLMWFIPNKILRHFLAISLISIAFLTHLTNGQKASIITQANQNFWWQVSWRVPQLEKNTTLVANYAVGATEEDYFVWGPANLIYYPEGTRKEYIQPSVYAALLNQDTLDKTLRNAGQEFDNRRTIRTYKNYRKLLVLTQPTMNSCVHVIDGRQPEYSNRENASIQVIGPYSSFEHILTNAPVSTPPFIIFGVEPEHEWCYYYQTASLARQRGDWEEVVRLGEQAQEQGFSPGDLIEWMPFLQAYVELVDDVHLRELAHLVTADPYFAMQACQFMDTWQQKGSNISESILKLYCPAIE